jgi:hypothetical protein
MYMLWYIFAGIGRTQLSVFSPRGDMWVGITGIPSLPKTNSAADNNTAAADISVPCYTFWAKWVPDRWDVG